jgi:hypothetical protein
LCGLMPALTLGCNFPLEVSVVSRSTTTVYQLRIALGQHPFGPLIDLSIVAIVLSSTPSVVVLHACLSAGAWTTCHAANDQSVQDCEAYAR